MMTGTVRKLPHSMVKGLGRGVPPPVPPNKPIVPPKKDSMLTRKPESTSTETVTTTDAAKNIPTATIGIQRCNIPVAASRDKIVYLPDRQSSIKPSSAANQVTEYSQDCLTIISIDLYGRILCLITKIDFFLKQANVLTF